MELIYVAGPYISETNYGIERNIRKAEEVAIEIVKLGVMPVCTHPMTRYMGGISPEEFWIKGTMALMLVCDAVVLVEDWINSKGTIGEIKACFENGIPIFLNHVNLEKWLRDKNRFDDSLKIKYILKDTGRFVEKEKDENGKFDELKYIQDKMSAKGIIMSEKEEFFIRLLLKVISKRGDKVE